MLEAVWKHGVLFYAVGVMCVLGVISKITVSLTLRRLVKEAGKMGKSLHPLMKPRIRKPFHQQFHNPIR